MAINLPKRQALKTQMPVIQWLFDSDPSIRWQVMRDLIGAPAKEVAAERARVATEGIGARLLALQGTDGTWAGAVWNHGWDSTMHVLSLLRGLEYLRRAGATPDERVAEATLLVESKRDVDGLAKRAPRTQ